MARAFEVGDVVRFTGKFLRNTGQQAGDEGQKHFTVLFVKPKNNWVVVDEQQHNPAEMFTEAEMKEDPTLLWRHINAGNLQLVRK